MVLHLGLCSTQDNYVTQDSSSMCHMMPQHYLPKWQEEKDGEFVHSHVADETE